MFAFAVKRVGRRLQGSNIRMQQNNNSTSAYDLVVIGGGPGGYACAIKAAQLGLNTACVEGRGSLGGTCLNVGCIPSKALLHNTHLYHQSLHDLSNRGIIAENVRFDLNQFMKYKENAVSGLTKGIEGLFSKNKVHYEKGWAQLKSTSEISITSDSGESERVLNAKHIVIASGSVSTDIPGVEVNEQNIVSSTGALSFSEIPQSMIVVGAGVIGLELGSVWSRLGTKVTIIEFMDRILPGTDLEVANAFQKMLKKQGLDIKLSTGLSSVKITDANGKVEVLCTDDQVLECDKLLIAIGRKANTANLGLDADSIRIETDKQGRIIIRDCIHGDWRTVTHDNIYAIGDCIDGPMLAHKAEEEGIAVAEVIAGKSGHVNYNSIPSVIYTSPEIACVGQTEEQLKDSSISYTVGKFPFMANARARTNGDTEGFVKILSDKKTDRLLGVHIIGSAAGEMIAEGVIGIEYGASAEDLARTCHAHPTLSEAFKEACMNACGMKAIHF